MRSTLPKMVIRSPVNGHDNDILISIALILIGTVDGVPLGSTLPVSVRNRLADLFGQIVQEFEILYAENEALHQQLGVQSDRLQGLSDAATAGELLYSG